MANPILVFVRVESLGQPEREEAETSPMGVTECGRWETAGRDREYVLVLVDDEAELPDSPPFKAEPDMPLLIVAHNGSERFPDPMAAVRTQWQWRGIVDVCKHFSHVDSDGVYKEIRSVLEAPGKAGAFARECRSGHRLAALEGLAALCQLQMLGMDPEDPEGGRLLDECLGRVERGFANRFAEKFDRGECECALELVKQEASRLAGAGI